ncbi:serine hydrolase domain-containing protein [Promicromonospora kroppenstedtii]|uniref:serine hydrolase domain-containing protein n=1 Tax=Promicromonospora kroppenstedtii TaxID=440482 RepID=UPI0004B241CD|nr:serine hydrolase domain-containing protein [Promicromonospora kroppenstedtii]
MRNDRTGARRVRLRAARGIALLTVAVIAFTPAASAGAAAARAAAAGAASAGAAPANGTGAPFRENVSTARADGVGSDGRAADGVDASDDAFDGTVDDAVDGTVDGTVDAAVDAAVDEHLTEYLRVHRTPGLALVTLADGDVRVRVHGTTGAGEPVGEDTPMRIGSMSKAFTALAVLQQVDAERFDLDDPVAKLLPELHLADDRYRSITVEHLLTHRSGLAATALEYASDPASAPAETVARLADEELASAPGTTTLYSNAGYAVLARLVERTTDADFGDYLEREIFTPLGMASTTTTDRCDVEPAGLARGFTLFGPVRLAVPELPLACAGSGGIVSTARDMAAWLRFQVGEGTSPDTGEVLLRPETFAAFHKVPDDEVPDDEVPDGEVPEESTYGYGWHSTTADTNAPTSTPGTSAADTSTPTTSTPDSSDTRTDGEGTSERAPLVGHGGTLATFASGIEFSPHTGTGAVVLANGAGEPMVLTHNAIVAVDGGTTLPTSNPFDMFNAVLSGIAALVLLGGVLVVVRSRRWAERRAGRRAERTAEGSAAGTRHATVLRLVPLALFVPLGAALPWLGATLMGVGEPVAAYRIVLWLYPAVLLLGVAIVLAAGSGLTARLVQLMRLERPRQAGQARQARQARQAGRPTPVTPGRGPRR